MQTEIVQRTKAPVVPSTPIDAPSAAIRNPGLASATTKPSHQVIALRSCLSSTSACAIDLPLSSWWPQTGNGRTNWYRPTQGSSTTPLGHPAIGAYDSCKGNAHAAGSSRGSDRPSRRADEGTSGPARDAPGSRGPERRADGD